MSLKRPRPLILTEPCGIRAPKYTLTASLGPASPTTTPDVSVEDITSLPIDQIEGWWNIIEGGISFQYPVIGARELQAGKLYAWQIKKELQTTIGVEPYLSTISVFKLTDPSSSQDFSSTSSQIITDPMMITLKDLLGEENFGIYFGDDGELTNYIPSGTYQINNENATSNDIRQIIDQLQKGTISVVNISIE